MPVRGSTLIRRVLAVLKKYSNFHFDSKYWYTTREGRFYLVHLPSRSRYDRVETKDDKRSVNVEWLNEEIRKWSQAEAMLTEEKKYEYSENQISEGYVTYIDFGGTSVANKVTISPFYVSAEREILRDMNLEEEMRFFEARNTVEAAYEEEEEVEYEDDVSEEGKTDDEDYTNEGVICQNTRGAKRVLEEKENQNRELQKELKKARNSQAKCCVEDCEQVGEGMRCCGGHSFCVPHSQEYALIRQLNVNPVCFEKNCKERLMLRTMRDYVPKFVFRKMRADEARAAVSSQEVRYDGQSKNVCVSVKELECTICHQVASRPVNVECDTRRVGEACEMVYCEECVCRMRTKMKKCPTCSKHWNGNYSKNLFLQKMCDAVPASHK